MIEVKHLTKEELEAGLEVIRQSPKDEGTLELIVRRPAEGEREILEKGEITKTSGLEGDNWNVRFTKSTDDGSPHPDKQLNIMNARAIEHIAQHKSRWQLAGDQLYIDLDLSDENLPHGTQLSIGTAVIEVTPLPHDGCKKFVSRFGVEAMKFVNSPIGKQLHLRGINAKVIKDGVIRTGDVVKKI